MKMDYVEKLCEPLGKVKQYKKNASFFGNIDLEIQTHCKTRLRIISDRGEFSCFIIKKMFGCERLIPLERLFKDHKHLGFYSLESIVDFLKTHLKMIEKGQKTERQVPD